MGGSQSDHHRLERPLLLRKRLPKKYRKKRPGADSTAESDKAQGVTGAVSPILLRLAVAEATGSRLCSVTGSIDDAAVACNPRRRCLASTTHNTIGLNRLNGQHRAHLGDTGLF